MAIEEDVRNLQKAVEALHAVTRGHKWIQGARLGATTIGNYAGKKECACGASEWVKDQFEFEALPRWGADAEEW